MENEIRYYLKVIKESIEKGDFTPNTIVTATKLPSGATEVTINTAEIPAKIDYILSAYDEDMRLISNNDVAILNLMII